VSPSAAVPPLKPKESQGTVPSAAGLSCTGAFWRRGAARLAGRCHGRSTASSRGCQLAFRPIQSSLVFD